MSRSCECRDPAANPGRPPLSSLLLLVLCVALSPTEARGDARERVRVMKKACSAPRAKYAETTNRLLQSHTLSTGAAATAPWGLVLATVATVEGPAVDGVTAWAELATSNSAGSLYQVPGGVAAATWAGSAWAAKSSGTGSGGLAVRCATAAPSACACWRSDGGACTAAVYNTNYCRATMTDLGTTPVRIAAIVTCDAAVLAGIYLSPGGLGVATGTTRYIGVQLEPAAVPSPPIVTTTAAVTRLPGCY